jgi:hypothetical protein
MTRSLPVAALLALALACKLDPGGRCTGDADCQPGLRCADAGLCVVEPGKDLGASCQLKQDCVAWGTCQQNVCVLAAGSCVVSSDCAPWETCTDHACVPNPANCIWDTDCAAWQVCRSNACASAPGQCDTPTAKTDCASWQTCDATNHVCVTAAGRCAVDADCKALQTCTATHACASAVVLWGNLGVTGRDAVAPLATPSLPSVAFGPASQDARIDPTGALVYRDGTASQALRTFVPDALSWDATNVTWVYPAAPFSNDVVIGTPNCAAGGVIDRWTMTGAGAVLHSCTKGLWYDSTGAQAFAEPTGYDLVAWSTSDAKLLAVEGGTGFLVMDKAGVQTPVDLTGAMAYSTAVARVNGKDFWLALFDATGDGELWSVSGTGVAILIAAYPAAPVLVEPDAADGTPGASNPLVQSGPVVLDAAGVAYVVMSPSITPSKVWKTGAKVVTRVAGTTASTVVYDQGAKPTGANAWTSQAKPSWWVLPSGPMLVTGP